MATKKQPKKHLGELSEKEYARWWKSMNNEQRANHLLKQYEALTRNDNELAKKFDFTDERLHEMKRDHDSLREWADYERLVNSILDRDLVADAKSVKLFDNAKDPRDRSHEPAPPEHLRDKADLLWPFD